jgi:hypothetical protein
VTHPHPPTPGPPCPCGCGCVLTERTSLGFGAVQFVSEVLGLDLPPWQRWLFIHAFETEVDPDGPSAGVASD